MSGRHTCFEECISNAIESNDAIHSTMASTLKKSLPPTVKLSFSVDESSSSTSDEVKEDMNFQQNDQIFFNPTAIICENRFIFCFLVHSASSL